MQDLRTLLQELGLEALYLTRPENVRYLSDFPHPEDAQVLLTEEGAFLLTDPRYPEAERESRLPAKVLRREEKEALLRGLKGRVGFEAEHLPYAALERLKELAPVEWVPTKGVVERLRLKKTPEEVARIRQAQALAEEALAYALSLLKPGVEEREVALEVEFFLRKRGAEGVAFPPIVASGPRGALPHAGASAKRLQAGELVTLDLGAKVAGYHSDMTRTVALGRVDGELRRAFDAVLAALERSLEALGPGANAKALDALAREELARWGFERYFVHSLGHGVGLAVHEGPSLSPYAEETLEPGMVVTVEPGVYLPGVGGVRLEELVLITPTGMELLSRFPRGWQEV
ncbi:Peptidase M24 [Thermus sp. CCB_US3_UF1]|uniref:M24 family metallopeptidase n=1 Tax=Thermus sp. CCB_US3_UF1 TaxID=1111069 RepID=UPI000238928C|nr:Xaa-Pro peptidase family protein [Thermus sp. CCB_US3_UF1]AEV16570.1 Peptidase M24 [Thermus sp. CCB_US3_UF1]